MKRPPLRVAFAALVIVALLAAMALLPVRGYAIDFLGWMRGLGLWAPAILIVAYVAACLFFIPGLLLSIGAGFLFGVKLGLVTVSLGSTLGATLAFLVGRTLFRDSIRQMIGGNPKFAALDSAVGREGFKIVLLARLSPVLPFTVLNYALGLTPVALGDFVLASWIGMLPASLVYVYLGSTLAELTEIGTVPSEGDWTREALYVLGLVATIGVAVLMTRLARKAWREAVESAPGNSSASTDSINSDP